jgi:CxxC-x17-CxxC domain-containing protein
MSRFSEFEDKTLICLACRSSFTWTGSEQTFYADKGLTNEPKRCAPCRDRKKATYQQAQGAKVVTEVICAGCGTITTVPFVPTLGRPVLCRACFQSGQAA